MSVDWPQLVITYIPYGFTAIGAAWKIVRTIKHKADEVIAGSELLKVEVKGIKTEVSGVKSEVDQLKKEVSFLAARDETIQSILKRLDRLEHLHPS